VLEFTGPLGEKARVFFEHGQVRHATAPGREGLAAFNEIVNWKGGTITEVTNGEPAPQTINQDWQFLLMDAVRESDERKAASGANRVRPEESCARKVLVIDDSLMMLRFVEEVLTEASFKVVTAPNAQEGLSASKADPPDVVLLDYLLPDMKGDEVSRLMLDDPATAAVPVVFMSGFGADLQARRLSGRNVRGFLNKPFTSDLLIKTVETNMAQSPGESESSQPETNGQSHENGGHQHLPQRQQPIWQEQPQSAQSVHSTASEQDWWTPPPGPTPAPQQNPAASVFSSISDVDVRMSANSQTPFFCGDTNFFSLNWALQTIGKEKLSGALRAYWQRAPIELITQEGQIMLATTREADLYCPDAPITLVNVDPERVAAARDVQAQNGCPLFLTLARENLILRDPAIQLVHHYGQKLFAQLWAAPRVRFVFEQSENLPDYAFEVTREPEIDHWELESLRFIQFQDLGEKANYDPMSIPAYTRDGFERAQNLKLTVAEAQFASQFNGARSIAQIAKNLRLDLKFARLTLFRFLALEVVECWPPTAAPKPEGKGVLQRLGRSIGISE
jgi:DNA-binding response OmpR family regulator